MNRRLLASLLALTFLVPAPLLGQTSDADKPFETLVRYRQDYPASMTPAQMAALLNRVAWDYRDKGMRLLGKSGGANCPLPNGVLISCDYLVHEPTLTGHDVLSGRDDGTVAVVGFSWGPGPEDLRGAITSGARTIVNPVLTDGSTPPPAPQPPVGSGGVVPLPPGTGSTSLLDYTDFLQRLMRLENNTLILLADDKELKAIVAEADQQIKDHRAAVSREYYKWAAILGPILTGLVMWIQTRGSTK